MWKRPGLAPMLTLALGAICVSKKHAAKAWVLPALHLADLALSLTTISST
jgi:hypothetical protein